ncbi:hypothetical protein TNCV_2932741 [Trichonephila clavipes]|nr:hypothetical protein TNCV_2932741 [Trichonephila clavipes]
MLRSLIMLVPHGEVLKWKEHVLRQEVRLHTRSTCRPVPPTTCGYGSQMIRFMALAGKSKRGPDPVLELQDTEMGLLRDWVREEHHLQLRFMVVKEQERVSLHSFEKNSVSSREKQSRRDKQKKKNEIEHSQEMEVVCFGGYELISYVDE